MSHNKGMRRRKHAVDTVRQVLDEAELNASFKLVQGTPTFQIDFKGDEPPVTGLAYVLEDEERLLFYLQYHEAAAPEHRHTLAEFIARANFGIVIGNFEMDYETGGARYKTSVDYHGCELPAQIVRNAILDAMDSVGLYSDALLKVMRGEMEPNEAISEVEADDDTDEA